MLIFHFTKQLPSGRPRLGDKPRLADYCLADCGCGHRSGRHVVVVSISNAVLGERRAQGIARDRVYSAMTGQRLLT